MTSEFSSLSPSGGASVSSKLTALIAGIAAAILALVILSIVGLLLRRRSHAYTYSYDADPPQPSELESSNMTTAFDGMTQANPFTVGPLSIDSELGADGVDEASTAPVFG